MVGRFVFCSRLCGLPVRLKGATSQTHSCTVEFTTAAKRGRRKAIKPTEETLVNKPPKLIFPFTSSKDNTSKCTNNNNHNNSIIDNNDNDSNTTNTEAVKQHNPSNVDINDKFLTKEDCLDGRYYLFQSSDHERYRLPSVTTVLQSTLPNSSWFGLNNWRKSMIEEHGTEGYIKKRKEIIRSGTLFHELLEERLSCPTGSNNSQFVPPSDTDGGNMLLTVNRGIKESVVPTAVDSPPSPAAPLVKEVTDNNHYYSKSVNSVLSDVTNVMVIEGLVKHEELGYSGTVDCVAQYKGELCVIEWKTSNKPRPQLKDLYDYPLQIAAYAGALNNDPNYQFKVDKALIVVAYHTGSGADAHWLDADMCLEYWNKWLDRLNQFQTQFAHDLTNIYI